MVKLKDLELLVTIASTWDSDTQDAVDAVRHHIKQRRIAGLSRTIASAERIAKLQAERLNEAKSKLETLQG